MCGTNLVLTEQLCSDDSGNYVLDSLGRKRHSVRETKGLSNVPLHKWIYAMYLVVTARKGISSMQLAKEIGVTQKTAWFVLGRLREACGDNFEKLSGIIEIDEAFIGGKEGNKHAHKRTPGGGKKAI